jgi:hypothetical protein
MRSGMVADLRTLGCARWNMRLPKTRAGSIGPAARLTAEHDGELCPTAVRLEGCHRAGAQRMRTQIKPLGQAERSRQRRSFTHGSEFQAALSQVLRSQNFSGKNRKIAFWDANFFMNPKTFFLFKIIALRRAGSLNADQETLQDGRWSIAKRWRVDRRRSPRSILQKVARLVHVLQVGMARLGTLDNPAVMPGLWADRGITPRRPVRSPRGRA